MSESSGQRKRYLILILEFAAIFCVYWFLLHGLPLTVDDKSFWMLFTGDPDRIISFALKYGNGRLLGNTGVVVLLAWPKVGEVIRALVLAFVTVMLPEVLWIRKSSVRILACILLLGVSPGIFAQCYSWMSGFQNYVPQFFFLLLSLSMLRSYPGGSTLLKILICALISVCGICMQLYMEHSSLLNVLFAILLFAYCMRRDRALRVPALILLLSAFCGGLVMMSIPGMFSSGTGDYRSTYLSSGFSGLIYGVARNTVMLAGMYSENVPALGILTFLQLRMIRKYRSAFTQRSMQLLQAGLLLPLLMFTCSLTIGHRLYGKVAPYESVGLFGAFLIYVVSFCCSGIRLLKEKRNTRLMLAGGCFVMSLAAVAPMLLVWPMGYRGLFHSYLFLCAGILVLADESELADNVLAKRAIEICCAALLIVQGCVFSDIRQLTDIREDFVLSSMKAGVESIDYFMIPSPYIYDYWSADSAETYYQYRYGMYLRLNILPADVWMRNHYYGYE